MRSKYSAKIGKQAISDIENDRKNNNLIRNLIEIGQGKHVAPSNRLSQWQTTSLVKNHRYQTLEAMRVETENKSLLRRILDTTGSVRNSRDFRLSYRKVIQLKKRKRDTTIDQVHHLLRNKHKLMQGINSSFLPKVQSLQNLQNISDQEDVMKLQQFEPKIESRRSTSTVLLRSIDEDSVISLKKVPSAFTISHILKRREFIKKNPGTLPPKPPQKPFTKLPVIRETDRRQQLEWSQILNSQSKDDSPARPIKDSQMSSQRINVEEIKEDLVQNPDSDEGSPFQSVR